MKTASYAIESQDEKSVTIRDVGPWNRHPTVTNAAEDVVQELAPQLKGRRLFYYDSEGDLAELVHEEGRFVGFAPVAKL